MGTAMRLRVKVALCSSLFMIDPLLMLVDEYSYGFSFLHCITDVFGRGLELAIDGLGIRFH
jgi:hypothetical protein